MANVVRFQRQPISFCDSVEREKKNLLLLHLICSGMEPLNIVQNADGNDGGMSIRRQWEQ